MPEQPIRATAATVANNFVLIVGLLLSLGFEPLKNDCRAAAADSIVCCSLNSARLSVFRCRHKKAYKHARSTQREHNFAAASLIAVDYQESPER
jgi:hypothetical protein